jgi:hypothetical protein
MGLKSLPSLAIGSTKANVSNVAFDYKIGDTVYTKALNAVGTVPGNDVIPLGKYGAVAFEIGINGTIDVIESANNATGYDTALLAIVGLPAVVADHVRMGNVTVIRSDAAFTFGTTLFDTTNTTVVFNDGNANYPSLDAGIDQGTNETPVDVENWNQFVDNLNEVIDDLILANGDGSAFPGTGHTAGQSICMDDAMQAIRHQLVHVLGETYWYDAPAGSLKAHTHAIGQGGLIPWGSLGASNVRKVELHPLFPGGFVTTSLRGSAPSGNNTITVTNGTTLNSYVCRQYYKCISAELTLQDTYLALRFTLPKDFGAWATSNAIQIEYVTNSALSSDCHVDVYVYKSGNGTVVTNSDNNVNVNWSNIGINGTNLGSWSADDILELYIKLESRNSHDSAIGKIALNYTS